MSIFKLPDLGEGLPDAEVHQWHVQEGDVVKVDQLLVSMETAKAVVDVPSPQNGRIVKLYGKPGDIINTGEPLVEFEAAAGEKTASASNAQSAATVVGAMEVTDTVLVESATGVTPVRTADKGIKAMPAVRALAKQLNVDLTHVKATGAGGQVSIDDVKAAAANPPAAAATTSTLPANKGAAEPIRGVRRAMAIAMADSHAKVVPVTLVDDADLSAWAPKTDITLRVIRAIVQACEAVPALNAWFDDKAMERRLFKEVNIGIAMDSKDGLFVPVLKEANTQQPAQWRAAIDKFKEQVAARSVPPTDLLGGTITLSNFGVFAGRYANPIVVPPTVAILGTGRLRNEVVAVNSDMAIHRILPLSLTVDHRAITGGEAARFLAAVIEDLQKAE